MLLITSTSYATNYYDDFESYTTGDLNGQGDWTGSTLVDVQNSVYKFGTQAVSITSDPTTSGAANCVIDVAPSDDGFYSIYIRDSASPASNKYLATMYVYEGANIITGVCIAYKTGVSVGIYHLISGTWERFANFSSGTWYKIEIDFPTTSTHRIWLDGALQTLTTDSNFTNISSNPDLIKISRHASGVSGTAYFDNLVVQSTTTPTVDTFSVVELITGLTHDVTMTASGSNLNYLITESASTPATDDAGWSGTLPTSYTTDSVGPKTLYAWAMNTSTSEISQSMSVSDSYYEGSSEYKNLVSLMPGTRYASNPIFAYATGTWEGRQVHFPFVLENPWDSTETLMYYGGGDYSDSAPSYQIGIATADTSDLYTWTKYGSNPIIGIEAGWDYIIGPCFVYYDSAADKIRVYAACVDADGSPTGWIGMWESDVQDPYTFTYYGAVISPSGTETRCGDHGMIIDSGTWYCYYAYRTTTVTLKGIHYATSIDGKTWTKYISSDLISVGPDGSYDDTYIESGQVLKLGSTYLFGYTCYNGSTNCDGDWTMAYAVSDSLTGPFYKESTNPIFTAGSAGQWDARHVSTNFNYQHGGSYYFFYQGTDVNGASTACYSASLWSMGMTTMKISTYTPRICIY